MRRQIKASLHLCEKSYVHIRINIVLAGQNNHIHNHKNQNSFLLQGVRGASENLDCSLLKYKLPARREKNVVGKQIVSSPSLP